MSVKGASGAKTMMVLGDGDLLVLLASFTIVEYGDCTSGSRIWSRGGPQKFFPRFCRCSEAESGEQSEPILARVQGPP